MWWEIENVIFCYISTEEAQFVIQFSAKSKHTRYTFAEFHYEYNASSVEIQKHITFSISHQILGRFILDTYW